GLPSTRVESEGQRRQPARWGRWRRLAQEVRRLRWAEGWTERELARRLGVTESWVGALERGLWKVESYHERLAKVFGKNPGHFKRFLKN
ncbi:MAG: helix-turn-helix transcriptional regulator, partial [Deltaproteobacteria bacterium]|nr:helix-turn-helix transcriptional regulator [Deltaproteobacteria bacterium]